VTAEPKTDSFVEVDEITLDRKIRRIFTGWMFAESPGLNAVEHAVYDVWLKSLQADVGRSGSGCDQLSLFRNRLGPLTFGVVSNASGGSCRDRQP
jgi:hypothetical protein